jgi:hypothetical protein
MQLLRLIGAACLAAFAMPMLGPSAGAQTRIGGATVVERDVRGTLGGRTTEIGVGDAVYRDQLIATAQLSLAKLTFVDQTDVSIGPASTVKLDRFVYGGGGDGTVFNATRGAFRFVSGTSASHTYQVRTPQAIVGVRGTNFGVRVERAKTTVVLNEGAIYVCLRSRPRQCVDVTQPRTYVTVTTTGVQGPFPVTQAAWTFDQVCQQSGNQAFCGRTVTQAQPVLKPNFVNDGQQRGVGSRDPAGGRNLGGGRGD